tara:strand:+ start:282 stop:1433 length:1152 start_codon:yes stop_codon:yes gene_type:complete
MSYYKFGENDVFHNIIKTYPKVEFIIYKTKVYYNKEIADAGINSSRVLHIPEGHISLYELNVDRAKDNLIYPFLTKDGSLSSFKTVTTSEFNEDFLYGDIISSSYPLSASISRDHYAESSTRSRLTALKNTINFYKKLSPQFQYSSSARDLAVVEANLLSVPSIFYGSSIKKGTIDLKYFLTGSLVAHARDVNRNGELIQVGPTGSAGSGSIVGLALYNEGFLILTASSAIRAEHTENYPPVGSGSPKWINFATTGSTSQNVANSSFMLNFEGTNPVPVLTLLAHAPKGQLNHSNNYTFIKYSDAAKTAATSSSRYIENDEVEIKNINSSSFADPTGSFEKHVYISKIGVYDKDKNLIGVAKLATPIRKREKDAFTFKLKMDF